MKSAVGVMGSAHAAGLGKNAGHPVGVGASIGGSAGLVVGLLGALIAGPAPWAGSSFAITVLAVLCFGVVGGAAMAAAFHSGDSEDQ